MDIEIQPEREIYEQGELVSGIVVIKNDNDIQNVDNIKVELWELVQGTGAGAGSSSLRDEQVIAKIFTLSPSEEQRYDFRVQLPMNCRISSESSANTHNAEYWDLRVLVETSKWKKQEHERTILVEPAREFEAVYEVCEKNLKFKPWKRGLTWGGKTTYFSVRPSGYSDPYVSSIYFGLLQDDEGGIAAEIVVGLKPRFAKGLIERMLALFKLSGPTESRSFELTSSQIFLPNGEVNHTEIAKVINSIIEEVITFRT